MDQFELDQLPQEPEDQEVPVNETAVPEVPEQPAEEVPAAEQPLYQSPSPGRRSPYENSPYRMPHQPPRQSMPPLPPQEPKKPKKARRGHPVLKTLLIVLLLAAVVLAAVGVTAVYAESRYNEMAAIFQSQINDLQAQLDARENASAGNSVSGTPNAAADGSLTPAQVYAMNEKSVVLIETDVATGSGFILTEDGYVVTNYHVVEDGAYISVVMYDRKDYDAQLVGYDANNDVAVLKMEGEGFPAVTLGSSDALIVGDQVAAIGNPLGELTSTLTVGFVSAKERDVYTDTATINMMQTDCAINSGNSGGPLFNMKGEVVGITTAKYSGLSASGASIEGIGFAIPMDDVVGIIEDLMEYGYVTGAYLGVTVYSMDTSEASMYGLPMGCLVDSVTSGSCADAAGVRKSDIIIGLGGYEVEGYTDLSRALRKYKAGDTTTITVYRNGQELVLTITLDEKPQEKPVQSAPDPMPESGSYEEWFEYFFGE